MLIAFNVPGAAAEGDDTTVNRQLVFTEPTISEGRVTSQQTTSMITVRSEGSRAQGQHAIQLQNGECSSLLEISQTEPNGGHNNNAIKG